MYSRFCFGRVESNGEESITGNEATTIAARCCNEAYRVGYERAQRDIREALGIGVGL